MLLKLNVHMLLCLINVFNEVRFRYVDAGKTSGRIIASKDSNNDESSRLLSGVKDKGEIPDLNFPPPPEEELPELSETLPLAVLTNTSGVKKGTYASKIERHEAKGTLKAFKIAQKHRHHRWYANMTEEKRIARSRKDAKVRKERNAQVREKTINQI